jgi:hypothetical protein
MVEISEKDGELGLIVYAKGEPDLFDQGYIFNFELVFVLTFNIDGRIYIRNLTKYSHESPFKHLTDIKLQSHHYINKWCNAGEPTRNFQAIYYDRSRADLQDLEVAVKSLKKIHRDMDNITKKYGKPDCWQTFVQRFAYVSKTKYFVECLSNNGTSHDDNQYELFSIARGVSIMNHMLDMDEQWQIQKAIASARPIA